MRMLAERYGFAGAEEVFAAYLPQWEAKFPGEIRPMPGAEALLRRLASVGVPCALVTSGERAYVKAVLARFGWESTFRSVVSLEDVTNLKPHPEPYLKAIAALGFPASDCIGFEDSGPGVTSLRAAGAYAVAVHRDVETRTELHMADERMTSLGSIGDAVMARLFR
jgi:HAD superfamily hydrolase (TIGR01509 family)